MMNPARVRSNINVVPSYYVCLRSFQVARREHACMPVRTCLVPCYARYPVLETAHTNYWAIHVMYIRIVELVTRIVCLHVQVL